MVVLVCTRCARAAQKIALVVEREKYEAELGPKCVARNPLRLVHVVLAARVRKNKRGCFEQIQKDAGASGGD